MQIFMEFLTNQVCRPATIAVGYYTGTLSCGQASAIQMKIGHP